MAIKLWIDDLRACPEGWHWATTSDKAIALLSLLQSSGPPEAVSFDHDLGGDDTTRPVVLWMCENDFWPTEVYVHSMNPIGREWLIGMVERYAPPGTYQRVRPA